MSLVTTAAGTAEPAKTNRKEAPQDRRRVESGQGGWAGRAEPAKFRRLASSARKKVSKQASEPANKTPGTCNIRQTSQASRWSFTFVRGCRSNVFSRSTAAFKLKHPKNDSENIYHAYSFPGRCNTRGGREGHLQAVAATAAATLPLLHSSEQRGGRGGTYIYHPLVLRTASSRFIYTRTMLGGYVSYTTRNSVV